MAKLTEDMTPSAACLALVSIMTQYGRPLSRRRLALMALGRGDKSADPKAAFEAGLELACENRSQSS